MFRALDVLWAAFCEAQTQEQAGIYWQGILQVLEEIAATGEVETVLVQA